MSRRHTKPREAIDAAQTAESVEAHAPDAADATERYHQALREIAELDAQLTDEQRRRYSLGVPAANELEARYAEARARKRKAMLEMTHGA